MLQDADVAACQAYAWAWDLPAGSCSDDRLQHKSKLNSRGHACLICISRPVSRSLMRRVPPSSSAPELASSSMVVRVGERSCGCGCGCCACRCCPDSCWAGLGRGESRGTDSLADPSSSLRGSELEVRDTILFHIVGSEAYRRSWGRYSTCLRLHHKQSAAQLSSADPGPRTPPVPT